MAVACPNSLADVAAEVFADDEVIESDDLELRDSLTDVAAEGFGEDAEGQLLSMDDVQRSHSSLEKQFAQMKLRLKSLQQGYRRQRGKVHELEQKLVKAHSDTNPFVVALDHHKTVQPLPTVMATAIRTNIGDSSLRSAVIWVGGSVHHSTVRRWQLKAGTSIIAQSRNFHVANEDRIRRGDAPWSVAGFLYKSDATDTLGHKGVSFQTTVCKSM